MRLDESFSQSELKRAKSSDLSKTEFLKPVISDIPVKQVGQFYPSSGAWGTTSSYKMESKM